MKNIWKKIVALICIMALSVGAIQVVAATGATYQTNGSEMSEYIERAQYSGSLTTVGAEGGNTFPNLVYMKGTDEYLKDNTNAWTGLPEEILKANAGDENSGIWLNGEKQTGAFLKKYSGMNNWYIAEGYAAPTAGDIVTIKGTFYSMDGGAAVTYTEEHFLWNGTQWVDCFYGELSIKGAETENNTDLTKFYIKGTDGYKTNEERWKAETIAWPAAYVNGQFVHDTKSGVFVDGIRVDNYFSAQSAQEGNFYLRLRKYDDGNNYYYIENIPNVKEGTIITIEGVFYVYGAWKETTLYDATPVVIEKSQFQWNGTKWVDYVEVVNYPGELSYTTRGGSETNVYLDTTDTMPTTSWTQELYALNDESGIYVNGKKMPNAYMKKIDLKAQFVEGFGTLNAGDVLMIQGLFGYSTNNETVSYDAAYFQWNGSEWSNYELENYSGSLTRVDAEPNDQRTNAIYLKGIDGYLADKFVEDWDSASAILKADANDNNSGIFVNGVKQSGGQMKKYVGSANKYYAEGFTLTSEKTDVVSIKGTFYSQDGLASVTFSESKFQWNGSAWVDYVEVKNYQGTLSILANETNNNQHLYLSTTDEHTAENTGIVIWESKFYAKDVNSGIYVNGKRKADAFMKRTNTYAYYLEEIGTLNAGDKVTIEGTFFVEGNGNTVTFEEFNILWDGNCWLDCSEIKNYAEGIFWLDTNSLNTATNLYLRGSVDIHEDCTPSDKPDFGWTTTVGTTGFYKNGVACAGTLKNVGNGGAWYLGLENAGIEVGDKLTIKGTYGYNGRYVKFAEYNLWYTNDGWKITPEITSDTKLYGDANGDGELNSLDIARLIKHLNEQPVSIYKEDVNGNNTGADANGIDGVNDRDRLKIYEYILEGAKRTVDGSYTVQYYPVYLDDEDIKLGAYDGPRMSGKQNYTLSGSTLSSTTVATDFMNSTEFAKYKNAGFNTLLHEIDGAYSSQTAGLGYGVTDGNLIKYFRLAKEAGLDVYITSMGLNSYVRSAVSGAGATSGDLNGDGIVSSETVTVDESLRGWDYNGDGTIGIATMSEEFYYSDAIKNAEGKTILEADIEEILDFIVRNGYEDIFKGFMMADEPWYASKERYASAVALIKAECAERGLSVEFQGCLFPSYANTDAITNNYISYINAFGTVAGSLMYDFYPLQTESRTFMGNTTSENIMDPAWLTNLQTVATQGKTNKYKTGITLQSCGYGAINESSWFYSTGNVRRDPSSNADIQFQVYSALAFGMKKINYFTYWEHLNQSEEEAFTSSMVEYPAAGGTESVKTDIYTYVQNANKEITKFDHVFMDYDWVETKTVGSSSLFSGVTSANISGITVNSSSNASIISHMYDSEKQLDGYWLVNMAEPSTSTKATLNVTFAGKNKAMVYINGEETIVDLTNGVYNADLAVGEGIFIIPLDIQAN